MFWGATIRNIICAPCVRGRDDLDALQKILRRRGRPRPRQEIGSHCLTHKIWRAAQHVIGSRNLIRVHSFSGNKMGIQNIITNMFKLIRTSSQHLDNEFVFSKQTLFVRMSKRVLKAFPPIPSPFRTKIMYKVPYVISYVILHSYPLGP